MNANTLAPIPTSAPPPAATPAEAPAVPAAWATRLAPYRRSSTWRSLFQLVTTGALFVAVWWLMLQSLQWSYAITLLLSIVEGALLVRLFIFFHDCVHGSFFRWEAANHAVGSVIGVLMLTPYRYWRRNHVLHHATAGNLDRRGYGDVDTLTVREYLGRSRPRRFFYRLVRHPLVFLVFGPIYLFFMKHRLPIGMPLSWKKEWASIAINNVAVAAALTGMALWVGLGPFLAVQGPAFLVSAIAGIWLFYVQHQFADTYWQRDGQWDFATACVAGSSYLALPRVLQWATGSIGVHHVHHLCSAIPNYRLQQCMDGIDELKRARRMTLWQSLRCARLSLWDEERQRLVGFRDVRARASS